MDTKYTALNRFRISKHMTMIAFAEWVKLDLSVVRRTLLGITEPHDYHKVVFDDFYKEYENKILSEILKKETVT